MDVVTLFWHVVGFFAPALGLGALAAALAKLVWRQELRALPWWRLALAAVAAAAAASLAGLLWWGQDGRMITYAGMVLASAAALGWVGGLMPPRLPRA